MHDQEDGERDSDERRDNQTEIDVGNTPASTCRSSASSGLQSAGRSPSMTCRCGPFHLGSFVAVDPPERGCLAPASLSRRRFSTKCPVGIPNLFQYANREAGDTTPSCSHAAFIDDAVEFAQQRRRAWPDRIRFRTGRRFHPVACLYAGDVVRILAASAMLRVKDVSRTVGKICPRPIHRM